MPPCAYKQENETSSSKFVTGSNYAGSEEEDDTAGSQTASSVQDLDKHKAFEDKIVLRLRKKDVRTCAS